MPHLFPGVSAGAKKADGISLFRRTTRAVKNIPWNIQSWLWGIDFTHAYVGFIDDGIPLVYHSTALGVHIIRRDVFLRGREVYAELSVPVTEKRFHEFRHEAFGNVGKPYSKRQLVGIGLVRLFEVLTLGYWKPKAMPRPFRTGTSADVCAETMGNAFTKFCDGKFTNRDSDLWSPADCLYAMRALHRTRVDTKWTKEPPTKAWD